MRLDIDRLDVIHGWALPNTQTDLLQEFFNMFLPTSRYYFVAALTLFAFGAHAHEANALQTTRTWQDSVARVLPANDTDPSMPYRYLLPDGYDPSVEYPLVLFLHGAGQRGNDNVAQVRSAIPDLIAQTDVNYPAILLAPQLPRSSGWNPLSSADRTDEILESVVSEFSVDQDRLYVTGLSLGGFGTMEYLQYYNVQNPDILQFAAAAPTAGALLDEFAVETLQDTPVWLSHGTRDNVVHPHTSRRAFNLLAGDNPANRIIFDGTGPNAGGLLATAGNVRYTEYPTLRHNSWSNWYGSTDTYDWLFSQSLDSGALNTPSSRSAAVPEPGATSLLCAGLMVVAFRRRKQSVAAGGSPVAPVRQSSC